MQENNWKTCWDDLHPSEKLPPLKRSETDTDGWEDFDLPVFYFYGGLIPYVGRYVSISTFVVAVLILAFLLGTYFSGHRYYRTMN